MRKVIKEKLFTDNNINAIHIDDVLNILRDMIEKKLTAKVINGVMPLTTMYSDLIVPLKALLRCSKIYTLQ